MRADRHKRIGFCIRGDNVIVQRQRNGKKETGYDAGEYLWNDHRKESFRRACSEIECCFVEVVVHLAKLRNDRQYDKRCAKEHLTNYQGNKSRFIDIDDGNEQSERYRCNDVCIDNRNLINGGKCGARSLFTVKDSDCANSAEKSRKRCDNESENKRIANNANGFVIEIEEIFIMFEAEPAPIADDIAFVKAVDCKENDRKVDEQ